MKRLQCIANQNAHILSIRKNEYSPIYLNENNYTQGRALM